MLVLGGEWLWAQRDPGWAPWSAGLTVTVVFSLLIRHQFVLVERLRAAQADLAQRTRAEERNRIARELHDVIAHSLTVSLLHIDQRQTRPRSRPSRRRPGARTRPSSSARQSLTEVRATMGLLRSPATDDPAPPVPGIEQVADLVDQLRRAGADLTLAVDGDLWTRSRPRQGRPSTASSKKPSPTPPSTPSALPWPSASPPAIPKCGSSSTAPGSPGAGSGMGLENMQERARARRRHLHRRAWRERLAGARQPAVPTAPRREPVVIRVLLVDDQELVRAGLRGILREQFGFQIVGECADGSEVPPRSPPPTPTSSSWTSACQASTAWPRLG